MINLSHIVYNLALFLKQEDEGLDTNYRETIQWTYGELLKIIGMDDAEVMRNLSVDDPIDEDDEVFELPLSDRGEMEARLFFGGDDPGVEPLGIDGKPTTGGTYSAFTNSKGETIETELTEQEIIQLCASESKSGFIESLLHQWKNPLPGKEPFLTENQWFYMAREAHRIKGIGATEERATLSLGKVDALIQMFDLAKKKIRYPKIEVQTDEGPIQLQLAGPKSKEPETVGVSDGGGFADGIWYGRIRRDGTFESSKDCPEWVPNWLQWFAKEPEAIAQDHGHRTGNCCFCGQSLTDNRSVEVGYGPVCAANYGLPWGEKK